MNPYRRLLPYYSLFILITVISCNTQKREVHRAYYFWRTGSALPVERQFVKKAALDKLYTRVVDVDWSDVQGAIPVASGEMDALNDDLLEYDSCQVQMIPVVFITNRVFEQIDSTNIPQLAERLVRRCLPAYDQKDLAYEERHLLHLYTNRVKVKEIQIDCDWTQKTAPAYFQFLQAFRQLLPSDSMVLSATIRLHQYKYPANTGVPPVNRGMLMMYNITDPKQYGPVNSIFDVDKAKAYFTSNKKYPLPLDMALPAWSWCIIFRNGRFYQIENGLTEEEVQALSFVRPVGGHFYAVTSDTVYRDLFLRPGDEIKAEGIDEKTLKQAAALAGKAVNTDQFTVSLFELSEKEVNHYNYGTLNEVFAAFH